MAQAVLELFGGNASLLSKAQLQPLLDRYSSIYPKTLALFRKLGIHPQNPTPLKNIYVSYAEPFLAPNIGEHCIFVAHAAEKIAVALKNFGLLSEALVTTITERALIHDIAKPFELMRRNALASFEKIYGIDASRTLYKDLLGAGYERSEAEFISCSSYETGHTSLTRFIYLNNRKVPQVVGGALSHKIVHLADALIRTSIPDAQGNYFSILCKPNKRLLGPDLLARYPWMKESGMGIDESGELVDIPNLYNRPLGISVLGNYATLMAWVSHEICIEIQSVLSPSSKEEAEGFILELVSSFEDLAKAA